MNSRTDNTELTLIVEEMCRDYTGSLIIGEFMSKSHRLAWAAGFIDGDGFITIQNRNQNINGKQYRGHYLRLGACQANLFPLEELQKLFGGSIRIKNSGPNREGYNRKQQWIWQCSTKAAADAIKQLLPYFLHKNKVAELALDFTSTLGTTQKVTEDVFDYRTKIQEEIRQINSQD